MGLIPGGPGAVNYIIEQPNRGKRSIGIDISTDDGRGVLYKLVETADVFLTSFLPDVRQRLRIDVEHIRAVNPKIVYARGSGQGPRGADRGAAGLRRVGVLGAGRRRQRPDPRPTRSCPSGGGPAFGDLAGGMAIAGGIAAGLLQRATHRRGAGRRRLAPGPGHVAAVARHRGLGPLRRRPDAEVRPERLAQPAGRAATARVTTGSSP